MRRSILLVLLVVLASTSVASAQPGSSPPPPPPVYSPPPPPGYGYGYPARPQPVGLTMDEQRLLARGIISREAHIGGAVVSFFLAFGTGQAVQGRWTDTGWIFTVGEAASIAAIFIGIGNEIEDCGFNESCDNDNDGLIAVGIIGLVGFRVWELVDAFAGPASHNRRVRELHMRLGYQQPQYYSLAPYVAPTRNGGGVAGITIRF